MVNKNLEPGTIVWSIAHSNCNGSEKCIIKEFKENTDPCYYQLQAEIGTFGSRLDDLFFTKEEAEEEIRQRSVNYKSKLSDKIKTPKDLFSVMIGQMNFAEIPDYEAICVAREKIKEFFEIEI